MKKFTLIGKKVLAIALLSLLVTTGFAQTPTNWNFNADETKAFADWFKQPSTETGKTNAEVMGIDITRTGFSWDDMNTWADADGNVFLPESTSAYARTIWGGGFSGNNDYKGRLHYLMMSGHKKADGTYDEVGGYTKLPADWTVKLSKLAGEVDFGSVIASVMNLSGTSVTSVKLAMNSPANCYYNVRRNPQLKQIDMSGTKGHVRQFEIYSNALEGENGLVMNDIGNGTKEFGDWVTNISNNMFSFSTMPDHPLTTLGLRDDYKWSGYNNQYTQTEGYPIGEFHGDAYEIKLGDDVDLSSEYDIHGQMTSYTWKDSEGETITPSSATDDGWFSFDADDFVGKTYRCELRNEAYPVLALNTVWVKVVKEYTTGVESTNLETIKLGSNPVEDILTILASDIQNIRIYSLAGACVKSLSGSSNTVNIANLSAGIYTVKITTSTGEKVAKMIKK